MAEFTFAKDTVTEEERKIYANKAVLVTGANSGCGFECCKQLAESGWGRIILACRNKSRGEDALNELREETGKDDVFELVIVDMESKSSCREAAKSIRGKLDCIVLNAGRPLPEAKALAESPDGYCALFAMHVMGPVTFTDALLSDEKLSSDATVIYVASEAARGIKAPVKEVKPPVIPQTKEKIEQVAYGKVRALPNGNWDSLLEYGMMKLLGVLFFSALARKEPALHVFSVSPGSTTGTNAQGELYGFASFMLPIVKAVLPVLGLAHSVKHGTDRYVQLANRPGNFESGTFYASSSMFPMIGPIGPQAKFHKVIEDTEVQYLVYDTVLNLSRAKEYSG